MVYVTGDLHGDAEELLRRARPLDREDTLIVCGDFGLLWKGTRRERLRLDLLNGRLNCRVCFVCGNHENFDLLEHYPISGFAGGLVHRIRPRICHLMRGQVFELEGNTIFTFGGATSIDKYRRIEGLSWWREEMPSYEELDEGIANLKRYNNKVDYIITHSCGERALMYPPLRTRSFQMGRYPENQMLSYFEDIISYKHWYFGHFHTDGHLNEKMTVLYQNIVTLGE